MPEFSNKSVIVVRARPTQAIRLHGWLIRCTSAAACVVLLAACGSAAKAPRIDRGAPAGSIPRISSAESGKAQDVVMYALGLIDTGYRFGGRNPEAGLDCSGMVSYIYEHSAGLRLPHNAAQIASMTRAVGRDALRPGDLVFFNTLNKPFSHVGIYIGDDRFVHAPSSNGAVRIDSLSNRYYASRFEAAHTLFD